MTLEELETAHLVLKANHDALYNDHITLEAVHVALQLKVDTLETEIGEDVELLAGRALALETNDASTQVSLTAFNTRVANLEIRSSDHEIDIEELEAGMEVDDISLDLRLTALETSTGASEVAQILYQAEVDDEIASMSAEIDLQEERLIAGELDIEDLQNRVTKQKQRIREIEAFEGRIRLSLEGKASYKLSRRLLNRSKHDRIKDD